MPTDSTEPRITLHPHERRVQVNIDATWLADTTQAIELRERGYPPRQYLPCEDVRMDLLTRSETAACCPFKGDSTYYSFGKNKDVAWGYEQPLKGMEGIAERLAFYEKLME